MESSSTPSAPTPQREMVELYPIRPASSYHRPAQHRPSRHSHPFEPEERYGPDQDLVNLYLTEKYLEQLESERIKQEASKRPPSSVGSEEPDDVMTVVTEVRSHPLQQKPARQPEKPAHVSIYPDLKKGQP